MKGRLLSNIQRTCGDCGITFTVLVSRQKYYENFKDRSGCSWFRRNSHKLPEKKKGEGKTYQDYLRESKNREKLKALGT